MCVAVWQDSAPFCRGPDCCGRVLVATLPLFARDGRLSGAAKPSTAAITATTATLLPKHYCCCCRCYFYYPYLYCCCYNYYYFYHYASYHDHCSCCCSTAISTTLLFLPLRLLSPHSCWWWCNAATATLPFRFPHRSGVERLQVSHQLRAVHRSVQRRAARGENQVLHQRQPRSGTVETAQNHPVLAHAPCEKESNRQQPSARQHQG